MSWGIWRQVPALVVAAVALVAALAGTVYAAGKINGHAVKVKSLPGNRLALHSVPANRLKRGVIPNVQLAPGSIQGDRLAPGSVTGLQVDVSTLGQVPSAVHADTAESAKDAETALNAANAVNAQTLNGYQAGCKQGTRLFAGACWQVAASSGTATLLAAADSCASQGGDLPDAFALSVFAHQPDIVIAAEEEWSHTLATFTGKNAFSVVTVSPAGDISSALASQTKKFRCVIPLLG